MAIFYKTAKHLYHPRVYLMGARMAPINMDPVKVLVKEYRLLARRVVTEATVDPGSWPYHMVRDAIHILQMQPSELEEELRRLAQQYGGCVSCYYSMPAPNCFSLLARWCRLGLSQDTCNHWESLLSEGEQ